MLGKRRREEVRAENMAACADGTHFGELLLLLAGQAKAALREFRDFEISLNAD